MKKFCMQRSGYAPGYVVNTHGHWDHYWGNQVFEGAHIIGQKDILDDCKNDKGKLLGFKLLNQSQGLQNMISSLMGKQFKDALPENQKFHMIVKVTDHDFDLRGIKPTPPQILFNKNKGLDLDGTKVHLLHVGNIHSSSDTIVWIPSEKVLFAGDIFADCSLPTNVESGKRWIQVMDYILDELKAKIIIPGHGVVYDRARAENQRDYFCSLIEQFEMYYTDTIDPQELCSKINVSQYIDHRPRVGWILAVNSMVREKRKRR